jgi:nicotinate-nucleotide adenylyltransferase
MSAGDDAPTGGSCVALFGGSFNPPHVSHVLAVSYVLSVYPIDGVMVVPVYQHPFAKTLASFEQRLAMCELAMSWIPGVEVSDIERELGRESRTLYTIEELLRREPKRRLRLVIGADVLADLDKWHRFDRIAELAPPIVLGRIGYDAPDAAGALLPEVSSTQIRDELAAGDDPDIGGLLPRKVRDYIDSHGLYREPA